MADTAFFRNYFENIQRKVDPTHGYLSFKLSMLQKREYDHQIERKKTVYETVKDVFGQIWRIRRSFVMGQNY